MPLEKPPQLVVIGPGGKMMPAPTALAQIAAENLRKGREEKRDREAALAAARKRIPVEAEKALQEIQAGDRLKIDGVWFEVKQVSPAKGRGQVVLEVCPAERLPEGDLARDRMVKR